jgi:dihydropteroate synthase
MGVVNVTPDSFSDGGRYLDIGAAVDQGLSLARAGADILDIGGESTRPGADHVPAADEISRVVPVIERLVDALGEGGPVVSVDTYKARTAAAALTAGASLVNDIGGGRLDPELAHAAAAGGAALVVMHSRSSPADMQSDLATAYDDVVAEVRDFLAAAVDHAIAAGVPAEAIAVDPGIGFGKRLEHNVALLKSLDRLAPPGRPVLVGSSRKSMLGELTGRPVDDRLAASVASVTAAVMGGAEIVRVHDVAEAVDACRVAEALR